MTQYQKIEQALRQRKCTTMDLIQITHSTCPWRRIGEMKARGWSIVEGYVNRGGRRLRAWWMDSGECEYCGEPNPPGREKRFCCGRCRSAAYREAR